MRSPAHLVSIIDKHADMTERLNNMLDRPLWLLLHPAMRREMQAAVKVAVARARQVVAEETGAAAVSSEGTPEAPNG